MGVYMCGVDLGTSGTKTVLVGADGRIVAEAYEASRLIQPAPGWVEQDPDEMVGAALRTLAQCIQQSTVPPQEIAAVAFDGQMAGIATVDRQWRPVTPYDSWLDTRCSPYVERMRAHGDRILALTGGPPTYSHGPKILWWQHEHPDVFRRIYKFVMLAAYVAGRLAGLRGDDAFIDPTYLHFSCLGDTRAGAWSEELCARFDVPLDKLARIVQPWEVVGRLTKEAAAQTGLLAGTPVVAGAGDQAAAMLGAGILRAGTIYDAAGTASVLALAVTRFVPDTAHQTLLAARMVPSDLWYVIGYINGGGLNLRWWRDMLRVVTGERLDYPVLDQMASQVPAGSEGILFIPHLGGRVCPNQPDLRGAWVGLQWAHGLGHLYRALLESVAYEYAIYLRIARALVPETTFAEVRVVGGGARSDLWNQLKADVLGVPYLQLNQTEAAALGSAVLAGFGVGVFSDFEEAVGRFVLPMRRFEPDPGRTHQYAPVAARYQGLLEDAPFWKRVASLSAAPG